MASAESTTPVLKAVKERLAQVHKRNAALQQQLYDLEDAYLDATTLRGNVVRGWEGYLDFKRSANGPAKLVNLKRPRASDRIFAFSSISAPIPKSDLERDDETNVALQWADKYAQALSKPT